MLNASCEDHTKKISMFNKSMALLQNLIATGIFFPKLLLPSLSPIKDCGYPNVMHN